MWVNVARGPRYAIRSGRSRERDDERISVGGEVDAVEGAGLDFAVESWGKAHGLVVGPEVHDVELPLTHEQVSVRVQFLLRTSDRMQVPVPEELAVEDVTTGCNPR